MNNFYAGFVVAMYAVAIVLAANGYLSNAPAYFGLW